MPTVRLHAGTVTPEQPPSLPDKGVVGSGAVWDDGSDATYFATAETRLAGSSYPGDASLDPLILPAGAAVTDITMNIRAASIGTPHGEMAPRFFLRDPLDGSNQGIGPTYSSVAGGGLVDGVVINTGGVIADFACPITSVDTAVFGKTFADLVAKLSGTPNVWVDETTTGASPGETVKHRIYEVSVDVTYAGPTFAPPLRLTNRGDVFSSAPSLTRSRSRQGTNSPTAYL